MNTDLTFINEKINAIKPIAYAKNRNFIDGSVSKLSPYISRGVISTKDILSSLLNATRCHPLDTDTELGLSMS